MTRRRGVGIVGVGFGERVHVPAFRSDPRCDVVAIGARNRENAQQAAMRCGIPTFVSDWRQIVDDPRVDIISIATPPVVQPSIALAALQAGKHVFLEKPLGADAATSIQLVDAARRAHRRVVIDFELPELDTWKEMHRRARGGAVGTVQSVAVEWDAAFLGSPPPAGSWKGQAAMGGGLINTFASHVFHYLEWFVGPIARIKGARTMSPASGIDLENLYLELGFDGDVGAEVAITRNTRGRSVHQIVLSGDRGTLVLENQSRDVVKGFALSTADKKGAISPAFHDHGAPPDRDGRIFAVGRLVKRFVDSLETENDLRPGLTDAIRVDDLIRTAVAAIESRSWHDVPKPVLS